MNAEDLASLLSAMPAQLEKLRDAILKEAGDDWEPLEIREGEYLVKQDDPGNAVYILVEGLLQASITGKDGREIDVAAIEKGEIIGEIGILMGGKRTANVYARRDSLLIRLSKPIFQRIAEAAPEAIADMQAIIRRRLLRNRLVDGLPGLFGPLDESIIRDIESEAEWIHLPGGRALFRQGERDDSLYIVLSGRLRAVAELADGSGETKILNEIFQGESIGEIALITGEPRSAGVYAVRDSELVRLTKSSYEAIAGKYPGLMTSLFKVLISRLRRGEGTMPEERRMKTVAVVPVSRDVPLTDFARRLTTALSTMPSFTARHLSSPVIDSVLGLEAASGITREDPRDTWLTAWLQEQEDKADFIIYEADPTSTAWTDRCIRQADEILFVASAAGNPAVSEIETSLRPLGDSIARARRALVLIHPDRSRLPSGSEKWLAPRLLDAHYHICRQDEEDFQRLARHLSGRAVGLVLGGGGARGFAHIGVIRALREAGVPIDLIGGTSMGAIISAEYAMGWDYETMLRVNRETFIEAKPLRDYTLPIISIIRGRKFDRLAVQICGDARIEDLWVNYFCISCNLTTSEMVVNRSGPVKTAIRASGSLPGVLTPVLDKHDLFVDGGVLNNVPLDIMRTITGGSVVVVNVSPDKDLSYDQDALPSPWKVLARRLIPTKEAIQVPNILAIMMRSTVINSVYKAKSAKVDADLYLRPPIQEFGLLEFKSLDRIVEVGYEYTKKRLEDRGNGWIR